MTFPPESYLNTHHKEGGGENMENNKRKRWQNGKVLMAGVLSAAMILQPMTVFGSRYASR